MAIDPKDPAVQARLDRGEIISEGLPADQSGKRGARAIGIIAAPPERVYSVITDYETYKEFMPRTVASKIVKREADTVDFFTRLDFGLKTIEYTIRMAHDRANLGVRWTLVSGGLKSNEGGWKLAPHGSDGQKTFAIYDVRLDPGFLIPGAIVNKLVGSSLPEVIEKVRERVKDERYDPPPEDG